jgi:phosphotriesterase-related protein
MIQATGRMPAPLFQPPLMSIIRTVLGDIAPDALGVCYAHEHIIIDASYTTAMNPEFLLDDVDAASRELVDFYQISGRAMIDSMPCDSGRNVLKLAEISRRSGVHIVCPTGLHLAKYYDPGHWGNFYSEDELAELFIGEITQGIDARDYNGPFPQLTQHRAGLIKIATGDAITPRAERIFAAAAATHRLTGAPILTHTEQGTLGLEQIELLRGHGVDLRHVVLSHLDRKPDIAYHREILSSGVRVEYDSAFRWKTEQGNPTLDLLVDLFPEFPTQIMLGMDAARRSYWKQHGGAPGLNFLLTTFTDQMKSAGLNVQDLHQIFTTNPASAFAMPSQ